MIKDENELIKKVFPLISGLGDHIISITYGISSSQPVIDGAGIPAWLILIRHKGGEDIADIADDFDVPAGKIQRAIDSFEQRAT